MKSKKRAAPKRVAVKKSKENAFFSVHDIPAPAILYAIRSTVILEWNKAASSLLGYRLKERPSLKEIRPDGIRSKRTISGKKGIVPHTTKKGEEKLIEVIRKEILVNGKKCCLEWLIDQTSFVQSQLSNLHFQGAVTRASIVSKADLKGRIAHVNTNFVRISGYTRKELLGKNYRIINSGYHPKSFWTIMWKTITSCKTWRGEIKNRAKDGSYYWVDTLMMPFTDEKGHVQEFLSIQNDTTAFRKVYDELNAILNTSTDATFFLDDQYRIRLFNKTGENNIRTFYHKQVHVGDSMLEYLTKESIQEFKTNFKSALKGKPIEIEKEEIYSDHVHQWSQLRYLPVMNNHGSIIGVSVSATDITSRKLAEQELFRSRKYFELLVNSQSSYLIRTDMDGKYTFVNAKFLDKFNYKREELLGTSSLDTVVEQDHELCRQTINNCFAQPGKAVPVTLRKPKANGGYYWTEWEFVALQDEAGNLMGIQAVGLDATERVSAIREVRENEERFRTLINDISIGILLQGPRSEIHLANQAALNLLGLSEDQLLGRTSFNPAWNVIHEDGSDFVNTDFPVVQAIQTKLPIRGVVMGVYRSRLNDRVWLLVDAIPRLDENGDIKNVICTFNNITSLKAAETSLLFTRFTIDHSSDAVFWIRPDAGFADMNHAAYTSLGYKFKEMMSMSVSDIDVSYTDKNWLEQWKELKEKKTLTFTTWLKRKNGTQLAVEINSNFITFREQEFNCAFVRDITERKKSEQALLDSNVEKDILIKEIHHRVKNNLQLISSILYIKMSRMNQSDMKDFLENMRQKIRSIALIHERLLQTGSVNEVDVSDYLGKLIFDLEMSNTRPDLHIHIDRHIEEEYMNLDTAIYCSLIINELVTNSIKHAFENRTEGTIKIVLRKLGDMRQLSISDDGISISPSVEVGQSGTFGMQMLEIFVRQLKGTVEIDRKSGTSFIINFRI